MERNQSDAGKKHCQHTHLLHTRWSDLSAFVVLRQCERACSAGSCTHVGPGCVTDQAEAVENRNLTYPTCKPPGICGPETAVRYLFTHVLQTLEEPGSTGLSCFLVVEATLSIKRTCVRIRQPHMRPIRGSKFLGNLQCRPPSSLFLPDSRRSECVVGSESCNSAVFEHVCLARSIKGGRQVQQMIEGIAPQTHQHMSTS